MHAERVPGVPVAHPLAAEQLVQARSQIVGALPDLARARKPTEREHREVALRDDVDLVPRPPHLHE